LIIYLAASIPFHLIRGIDKNIFNSISTNPWVNIVFFIIFIAFALSFFGLFEIALPGTVATKADSKANLQSLGGIFFMALTLAIVSFSCTGIILGVLLANVASTGAMGLTAGMAGFGFALALPFTLFAIFPHWLKALPKSGGWLDTVKKVLAFVELAMAFKFLSNADLVEHWGILKREVFIAIWMIISLALALFLFGAFSKNNKRDQFNSPNKKRKPKPLFQLALGFITLAFALYLIPGLLRGRENSISLLSGFAPPMNYSVYGKSNTADHIQPNVVNDYESALKLAKEQNKPILIDFTGWACVNCRKMEEQVWTDPNIKKIITNKFILVSLYVDDRKNLPPDQQFTYITKEGHSKFIKTIGETWTTFQAENFNHLTQPLYVILTADERLVNNPIGYTSASNYKNWLQSGLSASRLYQ
jgi:thiol:disulfide interchange protein DsbD